MLDRLKIGTIVTSSAALLMALMLGVAMLGLSGMRQVQATAENLDADTIPCVFRLATILTDIDVSRVRLMRMALTDDPKVLEKAHADLTKALDQTDAAMEDYRKVAELDPKELAIFGPAFNSWQALRESIVSARDNLLAGHSDLARAEINGKMVELSRATREDFDKDMKYNREDADNQVGAIQQLGSDTLRNTILVGVIGLVIGLAVMLVSLIKVSRPVAKLRDAMNAMAGGQLDITIPGAEKRDELGDIARALGGIKDSVVARAQADAQEQLQVQQKVTGALKSGLN